MRQQSGSTDARLASTGHGSRHWMSGGCGVGRNAERGDHRGGRRPACDQLAPGRQGRRMIRRGGAVRRGHGGPGWLMALPGTVAPMHVAVIGAGAIGTVLAAAGIRLRPHRHGLRPDADRDAGSRARRAGARPAGRPGERPGRPSRRSGPPPTSSGWPPRWGTPPGTASWLARLCGRHTLVAAAQNGLDHDARLRPYVGTATVVPALAYIAAERTRPGRVVHLGGDRIVAPTWRRRGSPQRRRLGRTRGPRQR